jgi:hypothetical protein
VPGRRAAPILPTRILHRLLLDQHSRPAAAPAAQQRSAAHAHSPRNEPYARSCRRHARQRCEKTLRRKSQLLSRAPRRGPRSRSATR